MSFLNSIKSPRSPYSSSVSLSSLSSLEHDKEQSSSSVKIIFVLPKPNTPVWKTGSFDFPRLEEFSSSFWTLDYSFWSWSKCVDDDEIFSKAFDGDLLLLLDSYICLNTFQKRLALSSKSYYISISSFISALKVLDKTLDVWALRYRYFFYACV
jgi:hypothetical protein